MSFRKGAIEAAFAGFLFVGIVGCAQVDPIAEWEQCADDVAEQVKEDYADVTISPDSLKALIDLKLDSYCGDYPS